MTNKWNVVIVGVLALAGVPLLIFFSWQVLHGASQFHCVSSADSFGCFSRTIDYLFLGFAFEIAAAVYLWGKFRGH